MAIPPRYNPSRMDAFIANHLKGVSRTYAIVIPMLPRGLDEAVGLAYLLMRIVDTLEDAPQLADADRRALLKSLDDVLADSSRCMPEFPAIGDLDSERQLMRETGDVLIRLARVDPAYRDAAHTCAREMIAGVLMMLDRSAARGVAYPGNRDWAELREYCYYVAGVVGAMLCAMMSHYLAAPALLRLREIAVELGIGLQLVNVLKDTFKDAAQDRRYLPMGEVAGDSQLEIRRRVLREARGSLERGMEFVLALPATAWELRSFCGLPIAWGAMTLSRAERDATRAKIDRGTILSSIDRFQSLARDDGALRMWFQQLLRGTERTPA